MQIKWNSIGWTLSGTSQIKMTLANEDMNRILDYLTRNDQELVDGSNKMENFQQDGLMVGICALS